MEENARALRVVNLEAIRRPAELDPEIQIWLASTQTPYTIGAAAGRCGLGR